MEKLPKSAQVYIAGIALIALVLMLYFAFTLQFNHQVIEGLIFFSILAVITDSLRVYLQRGGYVTVTFAVTYVCILLFGAAVASYVTIASNILSRFITRDKSPWYKLMFNCGQLVICIAVCQLVYISLGGEIGKINSLTIIPLIASTIAYFLVNDFALCMILALVQRVSPWTIWITNLKWTLSNFVTLSLLSVLMARIYNYAGYWGVSLFFVPLLLARYIFKSYMEIREVYLNTLEALANALDAKDKYTRGHSERVARYAGELARELNLPEDQIETVEHSALLHDIGKIGISDELLTRIGTLTEDEFEQVKLHSVIGADILKDLHNPGASVEFVRHHHEKYDGSGYPGKLKGEDIPLGARIITLADSFDAMTSDRSYRRRMTPEEALAEVKDCAGRHFDPSLTEAFIKCWQEKERSVIHDSLSEVASTTDI